MAREEKALAPAEVATARAALAAARGRKRLDVIFSARDPGALVRALPADELYFTIRDIGLADAAPLVPLASLDQFRTFLDLDAWRGDQLDPQRVLTWLRAARSGARGDARSAARWERKLAGIDRELLFAMLRADLVIHDLTEDADPEFATDRFAQMPDGKFAVEFLPEGAEYAALRGILDDLYSADPFQAGRLLSSLRWDLPSELEETALRWRAGRLADLGFPGMEEALSWFARPPARALRAPSASPVGRPGFFLASLRQRLAARPAARRAPSRRAARRVEAQLVAAANAVLVADQIDPADPEAVRAAFQAARALLELGLEARLRASGGRALDGPAAAEELAATPVKRLFQEGFGRVLALRWRAERLLSAGAAPARGSAAPRRAAGRGPFGPLSTGGRATSPASTRRARSGARSPPAPTQPGRFLSAGRARPDRGRARPLRGAGGAGARAPPRRASAAPSRPLDSPPAT